MPGSSWRSRCTCTLVADKPDLRRDIRPTPGWTRWRSPTNVREDSAEWTIDTDTGEVFTARFVVAASGILSVPLEPDIPGVDDFEGAVLFTSSWPKDGYDLTGKRVGVIGTGSTGAVDPVAARLAEHLTVLQRTPAYTLPGGRCGRSEPGG